MAPGSQEVAVPAKAAVLLGWVVAVGWEVAAKAVVATGPVEDAGAARAVAAVAVAGEQGRYPAQRLRRSRSWRTS